MGLFDIPFYIKNTIKSGLFKLYCKKNVIKKDVQKNCILLHGKSFLLSLQTEYNY